MSKCDYLDCEEEAKEFVYRGHEFYLCEIHFNELKKGTESE